jgi:hypothetical protein
VFLAADYGLNEKLQGAFAPCSFFLALLSISDQVGVMRHANPLVWRGDLMVWGLTGIFRPSSPSTSVSPNIAS